VTIKYRNPRGEVFELTIGQYAKETFESGAYTSNIDATRIVTNRLLRTLSDTLQTLVDKNVITETEAVRLIDGYLPNDVMI
jgi:hypothetical protein